MTPLTGLGNLSKQKIIWSSSCPETMVHQGQR